MVLAQTIVYILLAYVAMGVVFALGFVIAGAGRIDEDAKAGTAGFRLMIFAGSAALWPLLMRKWMQARSKE